MINRNQNALLFVQDGPWINIHPCNSKKNQLNPWEQKLRAVLKDEFHTKKELEGTDCNP